MLRIIFNLHKTREKEENRLQFLKYSIFLTQLNKIKTIFATELEWHEKT